MSVQINLDNCIGCGVCMSICPDMFCLDEDEGKANVRAERSCDSGAIKEAIESCPIGCINE